MEIVTKLVHLQRKNVICLVFVKGIIPSAPDTAHIGNAASIGLAARSGNAASKASANHGHELSLVTCHFVSFYFLFVHFLCPRYHFVAVFSSY